MLKKINPQLSKKETLLDLGCANGRITRQLKASTVIGIDLNEKDIQIAKSKASPHEDYIKCDAIEYLTTTKSVDTISALALVGALSPHEQENLFLLAYQALNKEGQLLLWFSHKHRYFSKISPEQIWSRWTWKHPNITSVQNALKKVGFENIETEYVGKSRIYVFEFLHLMTHAIEKRLPGITFSFILNWLDKKAAHSMQVPKNKRSRFIFIQAKKI